VTPLLLSARLLSRKNRNKRGAGLQPVRPQNPVQIPPQPRVSQARQMQATMAQSLTWAGPLPPPEILAQYNDCVPDGANRLIQMVERQQEHRHGLEAAVVKSNITRESFGAWSATVISLVVIGVGAWLIYIGKPVTGLVAILSPLAILASVFFWKRKREEQQLARKNN
jgi:uncharacterized membrane protein